MMTFNEFNHEYNLKNKATLIRNYQIILSSLAFIDVKIYLGHGPFTVDVGIVNCTKQKKHNGLHKIIQFTSVHMVNPLLRNFPGFF